jgi:hypothetical protein
MALVEEGQGDHAAAVADTIRHMQAWVQILEKTATALVIAGQTERVREAFEGFEDKTRVRALVEIAKGLARAGQTGWARRTAEAITDDWARMRALAEVAAALAAAGQTDHAVALVELITDDWARARALSKVAAILCHAGQPERARALASMALTPEWISNRSKFFELLRQQVIIIASASDSRELQLLTQTLLETERWWMDLTSERLKPQAPR